ncbi:MAG: EscU/YscU/HrcU family type III secretion system export apparatus switch protein [Succinivibrio sp.]|nr:EscU/YscU/HrcU family type III secretion system export apparatus switch protein [Succinivibrio sp.]
MSQNPYSNLPPQEDEENHGLAVVEGVAVQTEFDSSAEEVQPEILEQDPLEAHFDSELYEEEAAAAKAEQAEAQSFPDTDSLEAVSLSYDSASAAPTVAALGSGERAEAIVAMAQELGIYVHRDPQLLNELKRLKEGEQVPEQLFGIIATILSFSYILQGKTPDSWTRADGTRAVNTKA